MNAPRLFSGATRPVAIIIAVTVALHSANVYVASAVMPSVAEDLGGLSLYAWATTVFVFAAVLGSTACAALLARYGSRTLYCTAIALVTAGTLVCALAPSMPIVLAGRFVQGLGGGLLFALAYTLVHLMLPKALWTRAMSLISAMWGIGTFAGPALGGTVAELGVWRLAFFATVPLTLFLLVWGGAQLPRGAGREEEPPSPPLRGVALLGGGVLALSAAGLSNRPILNVGAICVAALLLVVWLRHERSTTGARLLPSVTFSGGSLRWLYVTMALLMVLATPEVFIAYFGQQLQGLGALAAGYLATALAAGWTSASLLVGGRERQRGAIIALAPAISAAGLAILVAVGSELGADPAILAGIVLGFFALGAGIGMAWPHLVAEVLASVPENEQSVAGSSVTTVQLTAASAGAALGGTIVNLAGFASPGGVVGAESAAHWLYLAMLVVPVLAGAAILRTRRGRGPAAAATALSGA